MAELDGRFSPVARAFEDGEFALWVGSGISRRAPNLGGLVARAVEFLRERAAATATSADYLPALREVVELAGMDPATLEPQFGQPFATWPEQGQIVNALWTRYSRVLDIRIPREESDFILWEAINVRDAFADARHPAAEHLCIAILVLEGAVKTIASANWDAFIEAAVHRLSGGILGTLQVVVDPSHMREPPGRATLLKLHGCIYYATIEPNTFRKYLVGSHTQLVDWPHKPAFAAMRNAAVMVATNQKALVLGLSIQDANLQGIFSQASQVNSWPWPCDPAAPAHVFCEDRIGQGQRDVLRVVYGDAYNHHSAAIHQAAHLRAWGEQVLIALSLRVVFAKLVRLMALALKAMGKMPLIAPLVAQLNELRDAIAERATPDPVERSRTGVTELGIRTWSRIACIFRTGTLPAKPDAYEAISAFTPALIGADQGAVASGLGQLAVALALLQRGQAVGRWELGPPTDDAATSGALGAMSARAGAQRRPLFLVRSATEALRLEGAGAFADDAIVVHADDTWAQAFGTRLSARRVRGAPGRTGRLGTTHISLGAMLARCDTAVALEAEFGSELIV
ncbi:SIR2 family protein [Paracraurococcus lichenis]|uniref:SIR2 family protein n=1 Tax=Paracraurococcus lichenis TaxID=3064888 RepID=A0ABT9E7Z3_9PROT|nr:SIR2 family protein [Paracraurococcus sp. LOR1-02]MDO9712300.1 SIR2 family protein [Paracraurococcus sp. LOR1-02]